MHVTVALRAFNAPLPPRTASAEARRLLSDLLAREGISVPAPLPIVKEKNGRPYLDLPRTATDPHIDFNLSHAGPYVVCALATASYIERVPRIGVDVEVPHEKFSPERLAARFFAPAEFELLRKHDFARPHFLKLWTQKESYLKLTGEGLAGGIRSTDTTRPSALPFPVFFTAYPVPGDPNAALTLCLPYYTTPPSELLIL